MPPSGSWNRRVDLSTKSNPTPITIGELVQVDGFFVQLSCIAAFSVWLEMNFTFTYTLIMYFKLNCIRVSHIFALMPRVSDFINSFPSLSLYFNYFINDKLYHEIDLPHKTSVRNGGRRLRFYY